MTIDHESSEGWKLWHKLSDDEQIKNLPPLSRLITGIRKESKNKDELIDNAYLVCEENTDIIKYEYSQWKGLAIFDATSVFSLEGIGGDLINQYGLSFVDYLRLMGELAKRTKRPAQYHQCINTNLQQSSYDDEIIIERMKSLDKFLKPENCGIYPRSLSIDKILSLKSYRQENNECDELSSLISITNYPQSYCCFTRRISLNLDGEVIISGPLFLNTYLNRPLAWLISIELSEFTMKSSTSDLTVNYSISEIISNKSINHKLRLLIESTSEEHSKEYPSEHYFIMYKYSLPIGEHQKVIIDLCPNQWEPIEGNQELAYGLKCKIDDPESIMRRSNKRLIFAFETDPTNCIYGVSMSMPSLSN